MLRTRISDALKTAMKSKQTHTVSTVRLIMAALKDRDIAARSKGNAEGIGDDEILSMLQSMIKQRRESVEMYEKGGRAELAEQEASEIEIIQTFLPEQMDDAALSAAVTEIVKEAEATSLKDMGKVMGLLKERYAGEMDFSKASAQVKNQLS
ncbi:MAG: GatB/YqeY domain-containing protein [Rhodospirillaceae bacterium]|nr:GatB/YqeY domain-containing protein [Rhodospirillaceae bacterium]MBL6940517.1 GatB/YqeY domain-containing protein [Rhodospirillales bacterium]